MPLCLSLSFSIKLPGVDNPPSDLQEAISHTKSYLHQDQLQALVPDCSTSSAEDIKNAKTLKTLALTLLTNGPIKSISKEAIADLESHVEGYMLTVPGSGASLRANPTLGLFCGLTTFGQLWYNLNGIMYTLQAPFDIIDSPAFPYCSLMLNMAHNYFPVEDIRCTLNAMSWHVVDSQSFSLVVPGYTKLSAKGTSYSSAEIYTPADLKEIVVYATACGIDIMVEINTRGHMLIITKAYPEHIACFKALPWSSFANEPPAGQLCLASTTTTTCTTGLLEAVASLFQLKLFNTGGDKLNSKCYTQDNATQANLAAQGKTLDQVLDTFVQATHARLST
ncbi:hypothetical protein H2248_007253 [Termitomyces sp. 'cryptogamus']|nr:hypothetical protein H2248_007253 [Termitomyces sp. 'cryptogamus']